MYHWRAIPKMQAAGGLHISAKAQGRRRARAGGELPRDLDLDVTLDALYGPIYLRFLLRHASLTEAFVSRVCDAVMKGVAVNRR